MGYAEEQVSREVERVTTFDSIIPVNRLRVIYLHPDEITAAPFEPQSRYTPNLLKQLMGSIKEVGILDPLTVTPEFDLIDGHRRLMAAKEPGMQEVPCQVDNLGKQVGFRHRNQFSMKMTAGQWLEAYRSGVDLVHVPTTIATNIKWLENAMDKKGIAWLIEENVSPTIASTARPLSKDIGWDRKDQQERIVTWMVTRKQQQEVKDARRDNTPVSVFITAIRANVELTQRWVPALPNDDYYENGDG